MLSAFKNFGVTFLIAAIIFGVVAYFAVGFVLGTVDSIMDREKDELDGIISHPEDGSGDNETDTPAIAPDDGPFGESFNFLIITTDYRPDIYDDYKPTLEAVNKGNWDETDYEETAGLLSEEYRRKSASAIVLVRVDKEREQYIYSYISPGVRVYTASGYRTLAEVYEYYGKQTLAEYVNALTGIKPKYTLLVSGYNLDDLTSIVGNVTANVSRDIYFDGMYYSMQYETTDVFLLPSGEEKTDHIPNTFTMAKGDAALNADTLYSILSVKEHSITDIKAKEAYTVDILSKYIALIGAMEKEDQKILLAKLITKESDWGNIDGLDYTPPAEADTEAKADEPDGTDEPKDGAPWKTLLGEPEDAVLDTNFTMNDFENITELITAVSEYQKIVLTFPCSYVAETVDSTDYFNPDQAGALKLYEPYKMLPESVK